MWMRLLSFLFGVVCVAMPIFILVGAIKSLLKASSKKYIKTNAHCLKLEDSRIEDFKHIVVEYYFDGRHIVSDQERPNTDLPLKFRCGDSCDILVNSENPEEYYFSRGWEATSGIKHIQIIAGARRDAHSAEGQEKHEMRKQQFSTAQIRLVLSSDSLKRYKP